MKIHYPAIFHKEEVGYWVEFPDLIGCQTQGESIDEAISMAEEALGLFIVTLEETKQTVPKPSDPAVIKADENDFVALISTNLNLYRRNKSVKKTLTIPQWLNEAAEQNHINFSGVLQDALMEKLNVLR